jgi:hypothetical protein
MGPALLIIFMVALFPVGFFLTGAIVSGIWGWLFSADADKRHEGSELITLNA